MGIDPDTAQWLLDLLGQDVRLNEPMSRHTSFRVGGPADVLARPRDLTTLVRLIRGAGERHLPFLVIGGGTNLVVRDAGIRRLVIVLSGGFRDIADSGDSPEGVRLTAGAGCRLQGFCRFAMNRGLAGMNFALGIPGTIGGAIRVNAGTRRGWISDVLRELYVLQPDGTEQILRRADMNFSYRTLSWDPVTSDNAQPIIVQGVFCLTPEDPASLKSEATQILADRHASQPMGLPSAGCFFKNPPGEAPAGRLIEAAGLKGTQIGGAAVSTRHANYIVNREKATAADILSLMELIQETVKDKFDIDLEPEVHIVGS
ncbi:UDP-N-acetylenolpyruvoylglucosamine reductase (EC [Olavius algarvensis associated proteobacterium Delta 3]|nr:UDP-N-acetylenolpyruvoylglucosamine reductase (EC [Olavius algarvensis associated proteobacterium Delta 3]